MKKYNLSESLDRKYKTLAENINESETPCLKDISEEDDNKSLEFEKEQSFAEKAWDLNRIISDMNNEEVLEDWLYEWPDGCDFGDCQTYFDNEERYQELFDTFKRCYKAFHSDGLYSKDPEVVELAHKMDKELRLRPIANYYKNLKESSEEIDRRLFAREKFKEFCNKGLKESILNEEPVPVTIPKNLMNDPKSVSFTNIARTKQKELDDKAALEKSKKEKQERDAKAKEAMDRIKQDTKNVTDTYELLEVWSDELVPPSGKADTIAGELIRAIDRIIYRNWNDGDKFFEGYGKETVGGSASYLLNFKYNNMQPFHDEVIDTIVGDDDTYTRYIKGLGASIINFIKVHPELVATKNDTDSRDYDFDNEIEEESPKYEFSIQISPEVMEYINRRYIDIYDAKAFIEDQFTSSNVLDGLVIDNPWSHTSDTLELSEVNKDEYDQLVDWYGINGDDNMDNTWMYFLQDLESEYGPIDYEDEEDGEELKEGAEGKRQQGFEFVIYLDEEPNKIIAIRSTSVEAEYYANKRNAGNDDDSVSFERVPKGRFKVGDSFQGPFDDNWKLQESISGYKVVDNKGKEIKKGDKIVDFRDGTWMFDCITKVPGGSSNGKISVLENPNDKWSAREFYPSVFDLKIVKEVDECASCSSELMEEYNTQYDFESSEELEYVFWDTFNSNKEDVANAEKYGLSFEYDSIEGPVWFGEWEDLNRFCNEYLGYELHPDFLFKKGKCNIVAIEDLSNKDFEDYYDKIYELAQGDNDYKPLFRKLRREASDRGL